MVGTKLDCLVTEAHRCN